MWSVRDAFVIGWAALSERSMILRRREPSPTRPSDDIYVPAASGPRYISVSRIASTSSLRTGRESAKRYNPAMPHMRSLYRHPAQKEEPRCSGAQSAILCDILFKEAPVVPHHQFGEQ